MGAEQENTHRGRRPEGKEGAGSHQEGKHSIQAGQSQRREHSEPEQGKPNAVNDHQKTVSGKKQHGPDDKVDQDAGGNEGSKGTERGCASFDWHREGAWRHRRQPRQESGSRVTAHHSRLWT